MKTGEAKRPNPFPGLRPFRSDEHHLFFGREEQTAALLQLLRTNRFLAVVGTSGSGKSSLVRAGMIAELYGGTMTQAGSTWEVMILRPGGSPVENLARALVDADLYDSNDQSTLPRLLATLSRSRFGLVEAMKQSEMFEPGTNLLVVVDQFEELFRFRQQGVDSEETAAAFVNLLLTASEQAECPIFVTITMRSDYLGDCSEIPGLAEAVNKGEYLIPRLLRDQKRDAIEKPIGVGGAKISPMLVQRLLNDVGDDSDQLPVLQHALMRMWDTWLRNSDHIRPIDFGDFEATGGLASALSNHADEIFDALPDDRHRSACEKIFKTLTEKGDDNRGIRRPTRLARLQAISDSDRGTVTLVLDAFRAPGVTFLMPGAEIKLDDRTVFDLSHESLMRGWQRLRAWVEDEAQSARIFRRLLDTARLWREAKAGLFRDPDLQIALSWREKELPNAEWAEQYGGDLETAIGFLEASNSEVQAELHAREASRQRELEQARRLAEAQQLRLDQQQRAARGLRMMIAGLAAVALIAALACVAALVANRRANTLAENARQNEEKANQNANQAERSEKRAANALAVVASQKAEVEGSLSKAEAAERSARAAEEAGRKLLYTTDMRLAPFVWSDDRTTAEQLRTLLAKHVPEIKTGDLNHGTPAVLKPDLRGFEWYYFQQLLENSAAVFSGHGVALDGGALTSTGQLTTLDRNGQLRRWDVPSRAEVQASRRELPGGPGAQFRLLSPDGRLAALTDDNMVHFFDTSTGNEAFKINWAKAFPRRLLFSRSGSMLVIIDDQIRWFSASSGAPIASVDKKYNRIESLAVSGDGLTLAIVGHGKTGTLFSIFRLDAAAKKATSLATDVNCSGTTLASALTSDGSRIAVGAKLNGILSVFDTASGRSLAQHESAHASPISAMAFSADANLATADAQGTIKIWAPAQYLNSKSVARFTLKGHQGAIGSVDFSIDGRRLISSSSDKSARVWDLENGGGAIRPLERLGASFMVRLSPDSQLIAAASGPNVRLWDTSTGLLVRELPAFSKSLINSVAFSPTNNRLLAVGYGGEPIDSSVALWDIDTGTELARLPGASDLPDFTLDQYSGAVGALAFSPDGKLLVAGFGAKNMLFPSGLPTPLKVWDVASRGLIRRLNGHTGTCVALVFSSDGTRLASGGRDGTAMIWSTKTWKATQTLKNPDVDSLFPEPKRPAMVEDVAFSPDGKSLAMASREGNVLLWDVATGKLLESLVGHSSAVDSVAFSPDGRTLASGSSDQTVRLWNVETRSELLKMDPADVPLGAVRTLAFSPDGKHLVAGGRRAAFWSAAPVVWANPDQAAAELRRLLNSNADFQSRIRMLSENLQLHGALEKLDSKDVRVRAALAATRANWHASRQEWSEAVAAFDRLVAADPAKPEGWLRTPGLFRLATALFRQDRPAVAATLLRAGGKRRTQDGLRDVVNQVGVGVVLSESDGAIRVTELQPEFPRSQTGLAVGDTVVKVNDTELIGQQSGPKLIALLAGEAGTTLRLQVRKVGSEKPEVIELTRERFVIDPATGIFLRPLGAAVNERLASDPRNAGLLELRAELAGQQIDFASQAADYTAAIKVLTEKPAEATSAHLKRLYHRRADANLSLEKWSEALDDYARLGKDETPDDDLLTNRAVAEMMRTPEKRKRFAAMKFTGPSQKLAAIYRLNDDQAAIDRLVERQPPSAGPIGDLFTEGKPDDKDWQRAIALYSKAITPVTTDVALLSKRARAHEALKNWEAAAADWSQAAAATPDGAKLLADSARRLAAHGKVALATVHFEAAQARYERTLADDPDNDLVVPELAQLLWDKKDNESPLSWAVLEPTKMTSRGGATLTKLDDRSILAGGVNPPSDIYEVTFTIPENTHARAIRLETLTHDSLPEKGPGRSMLDRGVFMLQNWDLTVKGPGTANSLHSLGLGAAHADYAWNNLPVGFNQFWSIASFPGKNHTSVWSLLEPVTLEAGTELLSRMQFNDTPDWRDQNLGRFRLSVSSDPAAFDREKIRFAAMKLTDPAAKLAVAFALYHRNDEALQYFSTALKNADGYEARKPIIALVASFDDLALVLSKRRPDDPQLQLALARQHAERGKERLALKQPAEARAELERSYEIFATLRTERRQPLWTVLKPTVMKSEGGATLTLRPDGAILASGKNPDRDSYSVVAKPAIEHITAIRLEALPDPSLPRNGPGRFSDSGIGGNFHLNELRVFSGGKPSTLANVIVNHDQIQEFRCLIDGRIDESMGWSNWPRDGLKNAAIVATRVDRAPDDDLKIELYCSRSRSLFHNLGCFRLSVTNDASAFEMEQLQNDLPDSDVAELNVALGKARALQGQTNEAAANFREALDLAPDRAAKAKIVMEAAPLDGVLEKLAELASGDAQVQAELARHFAIRQNGPLANAARTKARALFETALSKDPANPALASELADIVLEATAPEWITLMPAELTSQGGASLTLRSDGSILAGGTNPDRDVYTLVAKPDLTRIAAIRLEALTDSSLPNTGPGRSGAGNFHVSEIRVFSGGQPSNLTNIMVVYGEQEQFRDAIDGKIDQSSGWGIWPRTGQNNTALITTRFERAPDDNLKIELYFSRSQWTQHNLGCLRLSVSGDPAIIARERPRFAAMALLDPWARLAAARQLAGDPQALGKLLEQHPKAAAGIAELYAAAGDWDHAITEFRKVLASQPADGALLTRFGEIHLAAGRTREAIPLLAKASAAIPENTILSLKVAALQAWFGQDAELAASRQRILAFAQGKTGSEIPERAAKACSLTRPADKAELAATLALGRAAVTLARNEWTLLALGIVEYRSGHDTAAEEALLAAAEIAGTRNPVIANSSAFYRAMSLFRQGKKDDARKLAIATAAKMQPLPTDEKNPLAGYFTALVGGGDPLENLVMWLAYKEAKAMITLDVPPAPTTPDAK